jgi:Tfp pilus assembly pilus retraction ATPase PilT
MTDYSTLTLWEVIDEAHRHDGCSKVHLTVGRPPMVRIAGEGLGLVHEEYPVMTFRTIQYMLCGVVEPELWDRFEQMGEGELHLTEGGLGKMITLTVFRSSEAWSAVIHL